MWKSHLWSVYFFIHEIGNKPLAAKVLFLSSTEVTKCLFDIQMSFCTQQRISNYSRFFTCTQFYPQTHETDLFVYFHLKLILYPNCSKILTTESKLTTNFFFLEKCSWLGKKSIFVIFSGCLYKRIDRCMTVIHPLVKHISIWMCGWKLVAQIYYRLLFTISQIISKLWSNYPGWCHN